MDKSIFLEEQIIAILKEQAMEFVDILSRRRSRQWNAQGDGIRLSSSDLK